MLKFGKQPSIVTFYTYLKENLGSEVIDLHQKSRFCMATMGGCLQNFSLLSQFLEPNTACQNEDSQCPPIEIFPETTST